MAADSQMPKILLSTSLSLNLSKLLLLYCRSSRVQMHKTLKYNFQATGIGY
jgi:hypothetical protein